MIDELNEILKNRRIKLEQLRARNINPYPYRFERTHMSSQVVGNFDLLEANGIAVRLAGRLMSIRSHGKTLFAHIKDSGGLIQIYLRKDDVGEEMFEIFTLFDLGDIIGVEGTVFRTKTGEITIRVAQFELLTKALRPLPEKWHGLQDKELRYRRRYIDLIANPEVLEVFKARTKITNLMRQFLDERGFLEVETPVLQPVYGGTNARPFETHLNALDLKLYLRIADELYLKRLVIGGIEKVYEISKDFRNEGMDRNHNPEFTMLEFYWAYADYNDLMKLIEEMYFRVATLVLGTEKIIRGENEINLAPPFKRMPYFKAMAESVGEDIFDADEKQLQEIMTARGMTLPTSRIFGRGAYLDELCKELVEPKLIQPTFLVDYPIELSPLAKKHRANPRLVERFELYVDGVEYGNGFSELNDPDDQRSRFQGQQAGRKPGDLEAHPVDDDFLFALDHGMPPTAGFGLGVDRFVMLLTGCHSIRDVIFFPIMKPEPEIQSLDKEIL
ncbi:MAG: lysine--tRNA ligase [candidate division Zixibacteria bacterium RBG_16_53_22]|nr:MAG: lysine--tRNA ligase [candidate division Zixibacteria bacterium RBG_16_53_22]